ncbi:hypothetical protein CAI21_15520 [Alkalilimnicola ehrlichii]|uniref:Amidoligase enzyme n=1 Tax=Alkalilimnicola ehrlichii TaxID=351052 RepID=A0A3E0WMB7_9GAMM|nr:amidoligase family protein [Alkalilimnicola ehrlichii]RFA26974.1 hypothetical protein CAI21_15520 [Alkalilimnicola ehrlichii]RFA34092.1 hypothetical protein CAL65_15655 [Alkalilimnicola ehrlichii]
MSQFTLPNRQLTTEGKMRRLGIEFEFAGIELDIICELIVDLYGGEHKAERRFAHAVENTRWGTFVVEMDTTILKDENYRKYLDMIGFDPASVRRVEDFVGRIASTLVPHEIACPPIPFDEAHQIEALRERLRTQQALGTRAALRYAFGLHFNPEAPATDANTLLNYLRAFFLLLDHLQVAGKIDLARRIAPFINDFPEAYIFKVLAPQYQPDSAQLIDDYLEYNPTRNRPLDMLPLFAWIDAARVLRTMSHQQELIKPRPTFHYRLPNCLIDEEHWTIAHEWSGWVAVEALAEQPDAIAELSQAYLARHRQPVIGPDEQWANYIEQWLVSKNLA